MDNTTEITPATQTVPVLVPQTEASRILSKSEKWLERDRWAGPTIPYVKMGRHVRYRVADLLAYIDANTKPAADTAA
ncbi:helix-turn-helix domain-containing protein [Salibaculum griseiflavum]|uniref:DNA-binding protein n=1 Tax=Salibaculum griseiflavum TaxID=1914409 RepID=A0A2V1P6C3_9RHOB|nr:helix-turn-helix domain-containing protein [Salibaculum griseiflavum]PWG18063.1 DNA-binding protein [Salibaculum griseiflavum]